MDYPASFNRPFAKPAGPFEIRTVAPSDFITSAGLQGRYLMPSRDLLTNDIEVQVVGACLDGMVLLGSCDKTTPGQIMAAGRLNIPSLVVTCGYQLGGLCGEKSVDIEDLYKAIGALTARTQCINRHSLSAHVLGNWYAMMNRDAVRTNHDLAD